MGAGEAIGRLGQTAARQWGLVTTRQAAEVGVGRLQLSRLARAGALERLSYGVYRMAGAPPAEDEDILTAWLGLATSGEEPVAAGATAARLHRIGDLWLDRIDLTTSTRRTTRRPDVRLRVRELDPVDVTIARGIPSMTAARTVADLIEQKVDLSLISDAATDADRAGILDHRLLARALEPLASAEGYRDGAAFGAALLSADGVAVP